MAELKPCPFCGGDAAIDHHQWHDSCEPANLHDTWQVGCAKEATRDYCCIGRLCHNRGYATEAEAIAAWNTRAQTVFGMTLEEVRQMMKRDAGRTCHDVNVGGYSTTARTAERRWWDR